MADEIAIEKSVEDAVLLVTEAARLHSMMGKASTKDAVVAAIAWRFGDCGGEWIRAKIYDKALVLIDMMQKQGN